MLLLDTTERERRGLAYRRLAKLTMPWITENPLFVHLTNTTPAGVRRAVDDAQEVGMEMIIQSFGTTFDMENGNASYVAEIKSQAAYGKERGVEIGGYDLIVLDRANLGYGKELIGPDGAVGGSACFASEWNDYLAPLIRQKVDAGLRMIETDGPYGGGLCSATNHTHHRDVRDSRYWQTRLQNEFYVDMRERGVFVNGTLQLVPAWNREVERLDTERDNTHPTECVAQLRTFCFVPVVREAIGDHGVYTRVEEAHDSIHWGF